MPPITIHHNGFNLTVAPAIGGSVLAFQKNGRDILRNAKSATTPLTGAGFPLIPFAGRITDGRFLDMGKTIALSPNFPPEPHATHGDCWQSLWKVKGQTRKSLTLLRDHDGTNWPWRYRAQQHFLLTDRGLTLTLSITNLSDSIMPAGLGWHPYFPKARATLDAQAGPIKQPTDPSSLDIDAVYNWPDRKAHLTLGGITVELTASTAFPYLTIYTPPAEDYFCVEPWSHFPDALNTEAPESLGVTYLAPNSTFQGDITLSVIA